MTRQSAKPSPLGRGLSALFGDQDQAYQARAQVAGTALASVASAAPLEKNVSQLPAAWMTPGTFQPRRHFDETALAELAQSIKERGIIQPLLVRPIPGKEKAYEIIAGERRWRAAQQAGLHDLPVVIRKLSDHEAMEIGLIENIQREDLTPLEEARGYQRLIAEFSYTHDKLAKILGKSRSHVSNMQRLLSLPESVCLLIEQGELSMGHARAIINAQNPEAIAREILKRGLNVRQVEDMVRREQIALKKGEKPQSPEKAAPSADVLALEKDLSVSLGLRVRLKTRGIGGTLSIQYKDLDQLDDLIALLKRS